MEKTKQQKVESLVNELLNEFRGEDFWKVRYLLQILEKHITENTTVNFDLEDIQKNYPFKEFIFFSKSNDKS